MCPPVRRADTQVGPYTRPTIEKRPRRPKSEAGDRKMKEPHSKAHVGSEYFFSIASLK